MVFKVYLRPCWLRSPRALGYAVICFLTGCLSPENSQEGKAEPHPVNCVVIEKVGDGSSLARAGIQVEDAVIAWERTANPAKRRPAARGRIRSVLDWMELEAEQAPLGPIRRSH